jgi:branched-chain amino acid transport system permease protein
VGGVVLLPSRLEVGSLFLVTDILLCCIVGISLVIFTGWAGQISLGHFVFVGFGACAGAAVVNAHHIDLSLASLVGGGAATAAAIALAIVLQRRVDSSAFALLTLVLAVATPFLLISEIYVPELRLILPNTLHWAVYRYPLFGRYSLYYEEPYFAVAAVALGVILVVARNLQRSRTARVIVAGRENRRAALAMGLDVAKTQLTALAVSGFVAGFAGALLALHRRGLPADLWDPTISLRLIAAVVIGGASSVLGAATGAALSFSLLWFDSTIEANVPHDLYRVMTYIAGGGGMVFVLAFLPGGLAGVAARARDLALWPLARWKGIERPSPGRSLDVVAAVRSAPGRVLRRWAPAPPLAGRGGALLELRGVTARYGPMQVLFGIDLDVTEGCILGLLGTNCSAPTAPASRRCSTP